MVRPLGHFAPLLFLTAGLACGGSGSTSPTASIAGTWNLRTVQGSPLPITQQNDVIKLEFLFDSLTMTAASSSSGSYTTEEAARQTLNGQVSMQGLKDAGSYSLNGTAVSFVSSVTGATETASWNGDTLTVTGQGLATIFDARGGQGLKFVFTRQ